MDSVMVIRLLEGRNYYDALALLNSSLNKFIYKSITQETNRTFAQVKPANVKKLIFPKNLNEGFFHDKVTSILNAKKQDPKADTTTLEKEIDQLVYKLYGLTKEEIAIVEQEV